MNFIRLKKKNLYVENISAFELTKKYKTPFYCYSLRQLKNNFYNFSYVFKKTRPLVCFSVKSNSNTILLKKLKEMGSGADVVSAGELLKAKKAGINGNKIVFSGIGKTEDEIKLAIKKRVLLINMESESEAILINKISKKMSKITTVGIRLNPDVTGKTNKKISTGGKDDKFGLSFNDCIKLCKKIGKMKNLKLEGLSVHIGSQIKNIQPFKKVLYIINKVINQTKVNFNYVDLGGGMGISYSKKEKKLNLKQYASIVNKFIKNKKIKIIFEPGRSIVGNTSILISKVIYIKKKKKKKILLFWMLV
jgi:diaminopimelate decarboxylase